MREPEQSPSAVVLRGFAGGVSALAMVLVPVAVRADVVAAPPASCPDGLVPRSSHGGPMCAVRECAPDGSCDGDAACAERAYCVRDRTGHSIDGAFTETIGVRACDSAGRCDPGDRCVHVRHCVPREPTSRPEVAATHTQRPRGGGCSVAHGLSRGAAVWMVLAAAMFRMRRCRPRRRRTAAPSERANGGQDA